jgi:hypothetical protein
VCRIKKPEERPRAKGPIILIGVVFYGEVGWGGVDCIGLAEDRDKWRALANAVMNLQVP